MRAIFLPVFNWGQALILGAIVLLFTLTAIFSDPLLALYMGVGAYAGIVLNSLLWGLAPDQAEISEDEIGPISALLVKERFVYPVGHRVWAPAKSRSRLFKSDWISIEAKEGGGYILKARKRDLRIIAEIRRNGEAARRNMVGTAMSASGTGQKWS